MHGFITNAGIVILDIYAFIGMITAVTWPIWLIATVFYLWG